jgi:hypothetical protein
VPYSIPVDPAWKKQVIQNSRNRASRCSGENIKPYASTSALDSGPSLLREASVIYEIFLPQMRRLFDNIHCTMTRRRCADSGLRRGRKNQSHLICHLASAYLRNSMTVLIQHRRTASNINPCQLQLASNSDGRICTFFHLFSAFKCRGIFYCVTVWHSVTVRSGKTRACQCVQILHWF